MYNRRAFLKLSSVAALGVLAVGGNNNIFAQEKEYFPLPQTIYSDRSFAFNQQIFEPLVDTDFVFRINDGSVVSMRLIEVVNKENTKTAQSAIPNDFFSLIFENRGKIDLEDKIYEVSHSALGDFPMFISTVGRSGKRYQAVFNRVFF